MTEFGYHPWNDDQGQSPSPFVWSVIGALSQTAPDAPAVERFRRSGGGTKPVSAGRKVCWGTDKDEAVRTAHRLWANEQLPGELAQLLPTPPTPHPFEPVFYRTKALPRLGG
jgi:hypothetical protein